MRGTNSTITSTSGVSETCASCGGDPGGSVWEGKVLMGILTVDDIVALAPGALDHRAVVHLFRTGGLRGTKLGRFWVTKASWFIEDWDRLERDSHRVRSKRVRRQVVVEVAAR